MTQAAVVREPVQAAEPRALAADVMQAQQKPHLILADHFMVLTFFTLI
jgi:hypothetical protein